MRGNGTAMRMRWLGLGFLLCVGAIIALTGAATPPKDRITPVYDLYIGFVGRGGCEPLNVQFKELSIEAVFRSLRFKFEPVTQRRKTYRWSLASVNWPMPLMPIPGTRGVAEITDHEICPYWDTDDRKPPRLLKATLVHVAPETQPLILAVENGRIPRIQKKILVLPVPPGPEDEDVVDLVPLAPSKTPCVFSFTSNIEPGQTKITLEGSDAVLRIDDIEFYAYIPVDALLAGEDVSQEYPYKHPLVNKPGVLTVRYIPAKKRP